MNNPPGPHWDKLPKMELDDRERWEYYSSTRSDQFDKEVIAFAERWARLMQYIMNLGKDLEKIWEPTSKLANLDGLKDYQVNDAAKLLVLVWRYGSELFNFRNIEQVYTQQRSGPSVT